MAEIEVKVGQKWKRAMDGDIYTVTALHGKIEKDGCYGDIMVKAAHAFSGVEVFWYKQALLAQCTLLPEQTASPPIPAVGQVWNFYQGNDLDCTLDEVRPSDWFISWKDSKGNGGASYGLEYFYKIMRFVSHPPEAVVANALTPVIRKSGGMTEQEERAAHEIVGKLQKPEPKEFPEKPPHPFDGPTYGPMDLSAMEKLPDDIQALADKQVKVGRSLKLNGRME